MAYEGNVVLINGLIQANEQDYPLVHMNAVYVDDDTRLDDYISDLEGRLNDIAYVPIEIKSFSINPAQLETGSTLNSITISYSLNQTPASLRFNSTNLPNAPASGTNMTITPLGNISVNTTFTLTASDNGSYTNPQKTATKTASLKFLHSIYWGASAIPSSYDSSFLLGTAQTNRLTDSRLQDSWINASRTEEISFSANAGSGEYIFFALPTSLYSGYSAPIFNVGGFDGGFTRVATISHTNASGKSGITYTIWKSDNENLGNTTVKVK